PLTASFVLMYASMCSGLPEAWAPIGPMQTVDDVTPPLFVNGTADPATPLVGASAMQGFFPGARMVTVPSGQHGIYPWARSTCVNEAATAYLLTATSPAADIACPATTG
ncbi:MAG: hypothetical protein RLZ55_1812, partial [Actinomycetota bacterium]